MCIVGNLDVRMGAIWRFLRVRFCCVACLRAEDVEQGVGGSMRKSVGVSLTSPALRVSYHGGPHIPPLEERTSSISDYVGTPAGSMVSSFKPASDAAVESMAQNVELAEGMSQSLYVSLIWTVARFSDLERLSCY
jgi:hypothetical protein